jgi:hypothetical protein
VIGELWSRIVSAANAGASVTLSASEARALAESNDTLVSHAIVTDEALARANAEPAAKTRDIAIERAVGEEKRRRDMATNLRVMTRDRDAFAGTLRDVLEALEEARRQGSVGTLMPEVARRFVNAQGVLRGSHYARTVVDEIVDRLRTVGRTVAALPGEPAHAAWAVEFIERIRPRVGAGIDQRPGIWPFLVVIKRETNPPEYFGFADEEEAFAHYERIGAQWSDVFLCRVIRGPVV